MTDSISHLYSQLKNRIHSEIVDDGWHIVCDHVGNSNKIRNIIKHPDHPCYIDGSRNNMIFVGCNHGTELLWVELLIYLKKYMNQDESQIERTLTRCILEFI